MAEFKTKSGLITNCPKELKINLKKEGLSEEDIFAFDGMDKIQKVVERITELKVEDFTFKFDSKHPTYIIVDDIKYDGKANGWY